MTSSTAARILRSQATALRNLLRGWPLIYTGPASMTIEAEDIALAAELIRDRSRWTDATSAPL